MTKWSSVQIVTEQQHGRGEGASSIKMLVNLVQSREHAWPERQHYETERRFCRYTRMLESIGGSAASVSSDKRVRSVAGTYGLLKR